MDYSKFLELLNEHINLSESSKQRHMIRFVNEHQYYQCKQQLLLLKERLPSLQQIHTSDLIHTLLCPLQQLEFLEYYADSIIVEQDTLMSIESQQTPGRDRNAGIPWGVRHIGAQAAWEISTGHQIRIGVIDTGVDFNHPDLRYSLAHGINLLTRGVLPLDDNGHGTHIAGTIAAAGGSHIMTGVAPKSIVYPVKAFDHNGSAYVSDIVLGIDWCVRNQMHIINMSFGMKSKNRALYNIVNKAYQSGVIIVASSGNDKKRKDIDYPARYPQTISVGATDKQQKIASFSNRGPYVDIYAPGDKIYSSWLGGNHKEMSGTSMATSHVSGAIALLLAHRPGLTPAEIKSLIRRTARPLAYSSKMRTFMKEAGEIDAARLLRGKIRITARTKTKKTRIRK